jgi:hypothetical protein
LGFGRGHTPRVRYQLTGAIPDCLVQEKLGGQLGSQLPVSIEQLRGAFAQRQSLLEQRSRPRVQRAGLAATHQLLAILAAARCGATLDGAIRNDLEGRVPDGQTEELAVPVGDPQEPARPAAGHGVGKIAHDGPGFSAGGRTARQLNALLVWQDAIAEAQMKEVARHDQNPIHMKISKPQFHYRDGYQRTGEHFDR